MDERTVVSIVDELYSVKKVEHLELCAATLPLRLSEYSKMRSVSRYDIAFFVVGWEKA